MTTNLYAIGILWKGNGASKVVPTFFCPVVNIFKSVLSFNIQHRPCATQPI